MLNNLCIIILLIIASCSKPLSELSNLYSKNGSYFQSGGDSPFSGPVISSYESGQTMIRGNITNGLKDGKWIKWYDNGQKEYEKRYKMGKLSGLYTSWWKNGNKWSKGSYINGNLIGSKVE